MKTKRLVYIDYLKVIGLFLVIMAHFDCPDILMQIRSFDVPLLVFVSGYLASKTFRPGNSFKYYFKRIQRLVFPSWLFLIVFFLVQTVAYSKPTIMDMILAVTFQKDAAMVGMLWVIWVYLVCAFLVPLISKMGLTWKNCIAVFSALVVFEILCITTDLESSRLFYLTVMTIVPWGVLTYFGFYYDSISVKQKLMIGIFFTLIFIVSAGILYFINGHFVLTNDYKYPARIYYLSYSVPIIIILIEMFKRINLKDNAVISFISRSSLWIYLWHILLLYVVKSIIVNDSLWPVQYVLTILASVLCTLIQNIVINYLIKKYELKFLKVFLG